MFGARGVTPQRVMAHGVVGGVAAEAQGGDFKQGFMSSGLTKSFSDVIEGITAQNPLAGGMAAAVIGGTASRLTGGKFHNGAQTTAFQYLFNQVASELYPYGRKRLALPNEDLNAYEGEGAEYPSGELRPMTQQEINGLTNLGMLAGVLSAGPVLLVNNVRWSVRFYSYSRAGGYGLNVFKAGQRKFAVDYHKFNYTRSRKSSITLP